MSWKVIRQTACLSDSKLANHILSLSFEPVGSSSKLPVGARGKLRLALIHRGVSQSLPKSSQEEEKPLVAPLCSSLNEEICPLVIKVTLFCIASLCSSLYSC